MSCTWIGWYSPDRFWNVQTSVLPSLTWASMRFGSNGSPLRLQVPLFESSVQVRLTLAVFGSIFLIVASVAGSLLVSVAVLLTSKRMICVVCVPQLCLLFSTICVPMG